MHRHQLRNASVEDQECFECADDAYIFNSNDPQYACHKCPESATCPYGGPPVFGQVLTTSISVSGLDLTSRKDVDALARGFATVTGVNPEDVVIGKACSGTLDVGTGVCDSTARRLKPVKSAGDSSRRSAVAVISNSSESEIFGRNRQLHLNFPAENGVDALQQGRRQSGASTVQVKVVTSDAVKSGVQSAIDNLQKDSSKLASQVSSLTNKTVGAAVLTGAIEILKKFGWIYEMSPGGISILVGCPTGTLLVNVSTDLQDCFTCQASTYSLDPTDGCVKSATGAVICNPRECNKCPAGANCAGFNAFQPVVPNSCWGNQSVVSGGGKVMLMRVISCPPGYVLVRDDTDPTLDQCAECPLDYYGLERSVYPGTIMVAKSIKDLTGANSNTSSLCLQCPTGATCAGRQVNIQFDYWRGPDMYCPPEACDKFFGCDPRLCYKQNSNSHTRNDPNICSSIRQRRSAEERRNFRDSPGSDGACPKEKICRLRATVHICPIGACKGLGYEAYVAGLANNQGDTQLCTAGRRGPVCALCSPGYALSSGDCVTCTGTSEAARIVVFTIAGIAAAIVWYYLSWTPFFAPAPDEIGDDKESLLAQAIHEFGLKRYLVQVQVQAKMVREVIQPVLAWAKETGITECVKITIRWVISAQVFDVKA